MHKKEIFVLERQKLEELASEKELKGLTNSAFWNGSYVLDGIIDRDGYNRETLTLSARLAPPGKPAVNLEIQGKRSEPAAVINELVSKILATLRRENTSPDWKPADEAAQYYEEAKWAFKWGMVDEALAAGESAWALGKKDMDCAALRIRCQLGKVSFPPYGVFVQGTVLNVKPDIQLKPGGLSAADVPRFIGLEHDPVGLVFEPDKDHPKIVRFAYAKKMPNEENLGHLRRALEIYMELSRTLPPDEPKIKSPWCQLGVEALGAASQSLQHFHFLPASQAPVNDELSQLRALARSVGDWISKSPSVRAAYWTRPATTDAKFLESNFNQGDNIFQCEAVWGRFWQDKPEDCAALYRELMSAAAFPYLRNSIWVHWPATPRFIAWNTEDKNRTLELWQSFIGELAGSTNITLRLEAKLLELADARDENESGAAFDSLFNTIFANYEAIKTNHLDLENILTTVDHLVDWGIVPFKSQIGIESLQIQIPVNKSLKQRLDTEYRPRLQALKSDPIIRSNLAAYERQKQYLKNRTPYSPSEFADTFQFADYTINQAEELLLLLDAYRTNLDAITGLRQAGVANTHTELVVGTILRIKSIHRMLVMLSTNSAQPAEAPPSLRSNNTAVGANLPADVLVARRFFRIPQEPADDGPELRIFAHRWREDRLWLDLRYDDNLPSQRLPSMPRTARSAAAGAWNPQNEKWEIIPYPDPGQLMGMMKFGSAGVAEKGLYFEIFNRHLYVGESSGIKKYDFDRRRWESLALPGQSLPQLFAFGGHLYSTTTVGISEILDDGRSTRLLASTRRRPAATALDSLATLDGPALFPGPGGALRAQVGNKIYSWNGRDWIEFLSLPFCEQPEVFEHGAVLRSGLYNQTTEAGNLAFREDLWLLSDAQTHAELCLHRELVNTFGRPFRSTNQPPAQSSSPIWLPASVLPIVAVGVVPTGSNLLVFAEHCSVSNAGGHRVVLEKDGRHADLYCFERDSRQPVVIPLKFDEGSGSPPVAIHSLKDNVFDGRVWMLFAGDLLLIGQESMPGVWAIPRADIDAAMDRRKQANLSQKTAARNALLAKYDKNKNGVFDRDEKSAAIDDPDFLESQFDVIDANQNLWLDLPELSYFDANQNGILEPEEQAGIRIVLRLIAMKAISNFDANGDNRLDTDEYASFDGTMGGNAPPTSVVFLGKGKITPEDLAASFERETLRALRASLLQVTPSSPTAWTEPAIPKPSSKPPSKPTGRKLRRALPPKHPEKLLECRQTGSPFRIDVKWCRWRGSNPHVCEDTRF